MPVRGDYVNDDQTRAVPAVGNRAVATLAANFGGGLPPPVFCAG
jgi:hypothetical protein